MKNLLRSGVPEQGVGTPDPVADAWLTAFLTREAGRRTAPRRTAADVVEAIARRPAPRPRLRQAVGLVVGGLVLAALGGFVLGRSVTPVGTSPTGARTPAASPLGFPVVTSGQPCPDTNRWLIGTDQLPAGAALGGPPVYAFVGGSGQPAYFESAGLGGWQRVDILWAFEPGFQGRYVVHAARLDGSGAVSFGDLTERTPLDRVELDASWGAAFGATGWRVLGPLPMLIREPGCYGLRIDTDRGSSVSVFEIRPVDEAYSQLETRPLVLPSIPARQTCPVSPTTSQVQFRGFIFGAIGDGPVYLAGGGGRGIWVADSRELGPVLIRGGRIDGPGGLRFSVGLGPTDELRLPVHAYVYSEGQPPGWRQFVTAIDAVPDGCYAVQIDTLAGTDHLVFATGSP